VPDDPASPSWKVASPRTAPSHRFAAHSGRIRYELAELVFDSAEGQLTGVRGSDSTRQVTFHSPGIEIEVAIISDGSRRLVGQLVPAGQPSVALDYESRTVESTADSLGRFSFEDVPLGPISLSIVLADGTNVQTSWTLV